MGTTLERARLRLRAHLAGSPSGPREVAGDTATPPSDLEARVERLEAELEALQDATYRQDVMHDAKIAELRHNQRRV